ncbi:zinc finger BED domain-containing protein 4-like [Macrosteles quadrilineatus]|uniref:zinc finger BED domain-containing protein 4-like n=1 Tax=Macrosteles quadrilineatus TaxID=74068 RepID=UPI0023E1CFFC|nr:zinc finger BED domain-containing protein 4-like [Macrosteles quadrilineatus]
MSSGNFEGIPCIAHTLQLVVKDGLLNQRAIQNMSSSCRRLVGHFKHSAQACKMLKSAQQTLGIKQHKLVQDEPTRWNSTKHMMDRLLEQRRAIMYIVPDLKRPVELTNQDWELMASVVKLLKIFDDATFQSSSAQTTISEIIPIVNSAKKELEMLQLTPSSSVVTFSRDLIESLNKRYNDLEEVKAYSLATLLDPRLKGSVFVSQDCLNNAKSQLLEEAKMIDGNGTTPQLTTGQTKTNQQSSTSSSTKSPVANETLKLTMWKRYSVLMNEATATTSTIDMSAEREVNQYLLEPLASPEQNVCEYWTSVNATYPRLSKLSKKYLSAPPATVFSERLFSTSGIICDKKKK